MFQSLDIIENLPRDSYECSWMNEKKIVLRSRRYAHIGIFTRQRGSVWITEIFKCEKVCLCDIQIQFWNVPLQLWVFYFKIELIDWFHYAKSCTKTIKKRGNINGNWSEINDHRFPNLSRIQIIIYDKWKWAQPRMKTKHSPLTLRHTTENKFHTHFVTGTHEWPYLNYYLLYMYKKRVIQPIYSV